MHSLVQRLVRTLMQRGFDLDTRDARDNSLLSIAAVASFFNVNAEPAFRMLVGLGADPCRWHSAKGLNLVLACTDRVMSQLGWEHAWELYDDAFYNSLRGMVRVLASFGVDTVDNSLTGEACWRWLALCIRDEVEDEDGQRHDSFESTVAWMVLEELMLFHAKNPASFPVRKQQLARLPLHLASADAPLHLQGLLKKRYVSRDGAYVGVELDIHVRDEQGRTLQQLIEEAHPAQDGRHFVWTFVLAQLDEMKRQWMQHERPFLRRQLDEQTDLLPELRDLAMSFVDGLNHKGERAADAEQASAPDEEGGMSY